MTPPAHPQGPCQYRRAFATSPGSPLQTDTLAYAGNFPMPGCLHLPSLSHVYLSIIHPHFFHLPTVDTFKYMVMKFILCYLSADLDNRTGCAPCSVQLLQNLFRQRCFPNSESDPIKGLCLDHTSGPHQTPSQREPIIALFYFAASNLAC